MAVFKPKNPKKKFFELEWCGVCGGRRMVVAVVRDVWEVLIMLRVSLCAVVDRCKKFYNLGPKRVMKCS